MEYNIATQVLSNILFVFFSLISARTGHLKVRYKFKNMRFGLSDELHK